MIYTSVPAYLKNHVILSTIEHLFPYRFFQRYTAQSWADNSLLKCAAKRSRESG
ncbi:hypothetical protein VCHA50O407_30010 [Vibrio chagasii]|nr:hypothetical protein VCHA27O13_30251 [Vibrio chagasii]CAH6889530.1 hypothetical protein VCHA28FP16_20071 [Vibrio chagasii]CAH6903776.1 hypothetical protein VCHA31O71_30007 [Vibrio chagasii]CAH6926652.1 hypothetical protein VCHA39P226_110135 [Vibrio chagasii]CAH6927572.1 hypothetical protein VCHA35P150_30013 [Vibrio chagasii]